MCLKNGGRGGLSILQRINTVLNVQNRMEMVVGIELEVNLMIEILIRTAIRI